MQELESGFVDLIDKTLDAIRSHHCRRCHAGARQGVTDAVPDEVAQLRLDPQRSLRIGWAW
jgi:hypothetical protein